MNTEKLQKLIKRYEDALSDNRILYLDASEYIEIANYYWVDKDDQKAHETLLNGLTIHPNNDEIIRTQIELFIDEGNITKAREIVDSLYPPYSEEIQCLIGELFMEEGDHDRAYAILDHLLKTTDDADILIDISKLYEDMDDKEKAMQALEKAERISPNNPDVSFSLVSVLADSGRFDEAIKICNQIIDEDPYSFHAWMKLAECYSAQSQHDKAIEAAEFAMIANPKDDAPYILRGQSYVALENFEKALEDLYKILHSNIVPERYIRYYIGICHMSLGNYETAFENFSTAEVETDRSEQLFHHNLVFNMAKCLYKLGRYDEARYYSKMMISDSNDERLMKMLLSNADDADYSQPSLDDWEEIVLNDPTIENWYNLGITYLENKTYHKAREIFLYIKEQDAEMEGLGLNLLLACAGNNNQEEIRNNIDFILENIKSMDPDNKLRLYTYDVDLLLKRTCAIFNKFFNSSEDEEDLL